MPLDKMPPRRRQAAVKRARYAHCTWCGGRRAVWSFRIPQGGELATALDNRKLALLCRQCFDAARDDQDFENLNVGAAERLRLPEWYDDPATEAQRRVGKKPLQLPLPRRTNVAIPRITPSRVNPLPIIQRSVPISR